MLFSIRTTCICLKRYNKTLTYRIFNTVQYQHRTITHKYFIPLYNIRNTQLHTTSYRSIDLDDLTTEFVPKGDTLDDAVRTLADLFGECRMDIDDARESIGTTYYSDDALNAQESVNNVLSQWKHCQSLAAKQNQDTLNRLKQSWALKLEQLKGEYEQMNHEANDEH